MFLFRRRVRVDLNHFLVHVLNNGTTTASITHNTYVIFRYCNIIIIFQRGVDDLFALTFLNLGFSLALASSSSRYVLTPILQSITHGEVKSPNKSSSWRYTGGRSSQGKTICRLVFEHQYLNVFIFTTFCVIFIAYKRLNGKIRSMTIFRKRKIVFYRRTRASIMYENVHYSKPFYDESVHVSHKCFADFTDLNRNRCSDAIIVIL